MTKTQRTEALMQAARRYVLAKQAEQAIEQHNFDRLIRSGLITGWIEAEPTGSPETKEAIAQHNLDKLVRSGVIMTEPTKEGGLRERRYPPKGRGRL